MGDLDTALIEQTDNGLLLLGRVGEQLVEHYSFYAVFQTPEEYRLVTLGRELGTLSVDNIVAPGMMVIFSGRRWVIQEVHEQDRVITVTGAKSGIPPTFGGDPGEIHDRVIERMFALLEGDARPVYLDKVAASLLEEARQQYALLGLGETPIIQPDEGTFVLLTRCGTVKTLTLALALRSQGFTVETHDGLLEVSTTEEEHIGSLRTRLAKMGASSPVALFPDTANLVFEKYHRYLTPDLLKVDALSGRLDLASLPQITARLLGD
jgi:ATP-dependent Lhr-like helicase